MSREWVVARAGTASLSIASEGLSMTGIPRTRRRKGRSPRPSSPQPPERNEIWKDNFTPDHSAKIQG
jgi:hypothetical protein